MKRTKDYYFDLKYLPFTLALSNEEEPMQQIRDFDEEAYKERCQKLCDMLGFS